MAAAIARAIGACLGVALLLLVLAFAGAVEPGGVS